MRTVLVIASAIVNAMRLPANTASRTGRAPGGARCAATPSYYPFRPHGSGRRADRRAAVGFARGASRPTAAAARRAPDPAALHARARDAQFQVCAPGGAAGPREAAPALAAQAGRAGLRGTGLQPRGEPEGHARARPLVMGGARVQDPLPRGHRVDRREVGARPGV